MLRNAIEGLASHRGKKTAAAIVLNEQLLVQAAFAYLNDMSGDTEREAIDELRTRLGGSKHYSIVYRWPLGTADDEIVERLTSDLGSLRQSYDFTHGVSPQPVRICFGDVADHSLTLDMGLRLAPHVARMTEQVEAQLGTTHPLLTVHFVTLHGRGDRMDFSIGCSASPQKVQLVLSPEEAVSAIAGAGKAHLIEHQVPPTAILRLVHRPASAREVASNVAKAAASLFSWSECHGDAGQICYWTM